MAVTVVLKHQNESNMPLRRMYFYDGEVEVRFGVVQIPSDRPEWLQRVFMLGYNRDLKTGKPLTWDQIQALAAGESTPAKEPESTKSAGEDDEGSDTRRQPARNDGVRKGDAPSGDSVPEPEVGSSVSDGSGDRAEGDDTPD